MILNLVTYSHVDQKIHVSKNINIMTKVKKYLSNEP